MAGAVWMTRCLWPWLSPCAAGPCCRDQVLLVPHLPGMSLGMLWHVVRAVQAAPKGLSCCAGTVISLTGGECFRQLLKCRRCRACLSRALRLEGCSHLGMGGTRSAREARGAQHHREGWAPTDQPLPPGPTGWRRCPWRCFGSGSPSGWICSTTGTSGWPRNTRR